MKKFILAAAAVLTLSGCQTTPAITQYDSFDNVTEIKSPEGCSYSIKRTLDSLCIRMSMKLKGNTTIDQLKGMSKSQGEKFIEGRYVEWRYSSDNWLFVENIVIKVDGIKYDAFGALDNREVRYGGNITEWKKVKLVNNSRLHQFYRDVANGKFAGKKVTARVYGKNYYTDFNL